MSALPRTDHSAGRRPLADPVPPTEVWISLGLASEELRPLLEHALAVFELTVEDFHRRRYALLTAHGAELLPGAINYHVAAAGDLKLVLDGGRRSRFVRRRDWRALVQSGPGVRRDEGIFEVKVVAARPSPARRRA